MEGQYLNEGLVGSDGNRFKGSSRALRVME